MRLSAKKEIRNFLFVLFSAVFVAFLGAFWVVYSYGASGKYSVQNVLLAPDLIIKSQASQPNKKDKSARYVFHKIEFTYFDEKLGQWRTIQINPDQYAQFYQMVQNEKSLPNPSVEIADLFK